MAEESRSVSIRKIENGWVRTESSYGGESYSSKETFSKTKPSLDVVAERVKPAGKSSLRQAMDILKG